MNFCKDNNIKLLISSDGDKLTQNYNRPLYNRGGSFSYVEPYLISALSSGLQDKLRATIIPQTCMYTYENYLYAVRLGFPMMYVLVDVFSNWSTESERILRKEFIKISDHYINHVKTYGNKPIALGMMAAHLSHILNHKDGTGYKTPLPCNKCGLGQNNQAAISPTGDIYACHEMITNESLSNIFNIGNINEGVDDNRRKKLCDMFKRELIINEECKHCIARGVCNRGCVASNYLINGKLNQSTHAYCMYQRILQETAQRIVRRLNLSNE